MKALLLTALIAAGGFWYFQHSPRVADSPANTAVASTSEIDKAFEARLSNIQVRGRGIVSRLLEDDNRGSRHQRFILELPSGRTLLVAHNIDLAARIDTLKPGDRVEFHGEYEWNEKGGLIHWTHHDPQGQHIAGSLRHGGKMYQ
jgi:hypothetical protein